MSRARDTANQINRINSSAADATAITVDSSENVGIGTSSPSVQNNGAGIVLDLANTGSANTTADNTELVVRSSSRYAALSFITPTDKAATINFGDTDDANIGIVQYNHADNAMSFSTSAAERLRIDNDGLKFHGDTAAANALNDYEEGTWTPSSAAFTISSVPSAKYTKVGRLVTLQAYLEATSGNTNLAKITGLPFSCVAQGWSTGVLNFANSNSTVTHPHVRVRQSESALDLKFGNDSTLNGTACDAGPIIFTVTYETSS